MAQQTNILVQIPLLIWLPRRLHFAKMDALALFLFFVRAFMAFEDPVTYADRLSRDV